MSVEETPHVLVNNQRVPKLPTTPKTRFVSVPFTPEKLEISKSLVAHAQRLERIILEFIPTGREQSLALTHLEEVVFWSNRALSVSK